jgi:hypothetical protein
MADNLVQFALTWLQARWIAEKDGIVAHIFVEIDAAPKTNRIFVKELPRSGIVVSGAIVIKRGFLVPFSPGIPEVIRNAAGGGDDAAEGIVPGMIVLERWLPGESLGMRIHGRKVEGGKVSAPGTGAGDLPVSDAVRGESLVGRPIILMG